MPAPLEVCYLVCSGSEANELALRLARQHTGGTDFVVLEGAYHGHTSALIDLSPYKFDGKGGSGIQPYIKQSDMPCVYRGKHSGPDAARIYAEDVRDKAHETVGKLAGFFSEAILGCGGQITLPDGYLKQAYEHVRAAGGVCIADEVQIGFGRMGTHMWGFETQDAVPDIVTVGKPIGNGHPMAAVITTRAIADSFANGMEFFSTFGGNPVSCAAGLAVLDAVQSEMKEHCRQMSHHLLSGLEELKSKHTLIGDVRGIGLFAGVELVKDRETKEPATQEASDICKALANRKIFISTDGPYNCVLKIKPPLAI